MQRKARFAKKREDGAVRWGDGQERGEDEGEGGANREERMEETGEDEEGEEKTEKRRWSVDRRGE